MEAQLIVRYQHIDMITWQPNTWSPKINSSVLICIIEWIVFISTHCEGKQIRGSEEVEDRGRTPHYWISMSSNLFSCPNVAILCSIICCDR